MDRDVAVIGESMIEINPRTRAAQRTGPTIDATIAYGGDTMNFCVYMSRLGADVAYVSALGDDTLSDWLLKQWADEGVSCELVQRVPGAVPGLYLIEVDAAGERSFSYWRDQAPVRRMFDAPAAANEIFARLQQFKYVYLSGITLALFGEPVRERLYKSLDDYRSNGGKVLFDNNYRPRQWPNRDKARQAFESLYRRCDIALPTLDDEQLVFGKESESEMAARLRNWGVDEIVIKKGAQGCLVCRASGIEVVPAGSVDKVVDTTAAGDSFNAGYMAARLRGSEPREAAQFAGKLAARVVQHYGAIVPRDVVADLRIP